MRVTHHVEELVVPASVDGRDAADFIAAQAVHAAAGAAAYGTDEVSESAAEALPFWHDPRSPRRLFGVRAGGTIVGSATYETHEGSTTARLLVAVAPEHRRRGIGTALADHLEGVAARDGRTNRVAFVASAPAEGARVTADSAHGSLPAVNPEVRFLGARGYGLKLVRHVARLALPLDPVALQARLDDLLGDAFSVETWVDHTPANRLDEVARLLTQMSTDAPRGDLGLPPETWTAQQLADLEARMATSPRSRLYAAAVDHGELVGLTLMFAPAALASAADQNLTVVLPGHRGRRLGMVLKLANLLHLQREHPGHPAVITKNAHENAPMRAVNDAVGFVPIGAEGAWRRDG